MTEISRVGRVLKDITKCDKLNVAALGNMVPQLHIHIIARRVSDAAWPRPVWGVMPPLAQDRKSCRISSARCAARSGSVELRRNFRQVAGGSRTDNSLKNRDIPIAAAAPSFADPSMTSAKSFPLGQPAFVTHALDRAAHLRNDDDGLLKLEGRRDTRAYVVHRDSLVMKQDASGPRALLTIDEALSFGANPGTVFLGLRDGAAVFGMGIAPAAADKLLTRPDALVAELRGLAMQGAIAAGAIVGDRDGEVAGELASAPWLSAPIAAPAPR